jgi:hypothetical protein
MDVVGHYDEGVHLVRSPAAMNQPFPNDFRVAREPASAGAERVQNTSAIMGAGFPGSGEGDACREGVRKVERHKLRKLRRNEVRQSARAAPAEMLLSCDHRSKSHTGILVRQGSASSAWTPTLHFASAPLSGAGWTSYILVNAA